MEYRDITFEDFRAMLLYHRIVAWNDNKIVLDNGVSITIEETDQDCCAHASGKFSDVVLDAAITYVSNPKYTRYGDRRDEYGTEAVVKFLHNKNLICQANGDADAGNGGYYYSIASFVIKVPENPQEELVCHFVDDGDGWR
jgi:hypothetical protein